MMKKRLEKSVVPSIHPSVCPSVCNANKNAYSSIINSRTIIRISDEWACHLIQENETMFFTNMFFKNFRPDFSTITFLLTLPLVIPLRMIISISGEKA